MDMIRYMQEHERSVLKLLESHPDRKKLCKLLADHDKQISWMQHERLVHLITMMFVCLFFFLAFGFMLIHFLIPCILLAVLLLVLTIAYMIHYYRLENGVQRWYFLSNRMREDLRKENS